MKGRWKHVQRMPGLCHPALLAYGFAGGLAHGLTRDLTRDKGVARIHCTPALDAIPNPLHRFKTLATDLDRA